MEPMHHPITIKQVHHSLTCDGTDVELTRFLEYIDQTWRDEYLTLFNFGSMNWDNGHDVLRFITNCHHINLIDFIKPLSKLFPKVFFMYDFYTDANDTDIDENVYWLYEGIANTNKIELEESYKK